TWLLHEDGVDLNGIVLQSSILDLSKENNPVGLLPTFAATALYYNKVTRSPLPNDLASFMEEVEKFAREKFAKAMDNYPNVDQATVQFLSEILGFPSEVIMYWKLNPTATFQTSLLQEKGKAVG